MNKLAPEEALKKIKKAAAEGKIEFAPQDKLSAYSALLHDFMEHVMGITSYWLSDYSTIDEYYWHDPENEEESKRQWTKARRKYSQKIKERYGVKMTVGTKHTYYMSDIMARLAERITQLED